MIRTRGDVTAEIDYPCRIQLSEYNGWALLAEFDQPHLYLQRNAVFDTAPLIQLREKENHFALIYFQYDDMPEVYLPEWWKNSTVIWEKRAERDQETNNDHNKI